MNANKQDAGGLRACDALDRVIDRYSDHGPVGHAAGRFVRNHGRNLRAFIADLTMTVAAQQAMLAACFRMAGADCDGNEDFRIAPRALQAVTDLRRDYDQACEELHGKGEQCRAASVTAPTVLEALYYLRAAICETDAPECYWDITASVDRWIADANVGRPTPELRALSRGVPEGK